MASTPPMLPVNIGAHSISPQMNPIDPSSIQTQLPQKRGLFGGMFAGATIQPGNALAGFLAGMYPRYADSFMAPMLQRQRIEGEMAAQERLQNLEFQRQLALAQQSARLKLMYPDGDFAQTEYQAGVMPGTPQWSKDWQTHQQNMLDPAIVTPQGMMLRSQVTGQLQPPSAPVGKLTPIDDGGPTPPASGNFSR